MKANITQPLMVALALAVVAFGSTAAHAWTVNQHYVNTTADTAHDLTKILWGYWNIDSAMTDKPFASYTVTHRPGYTLVHWYNGAVPLGREASACFTTSTGGRPRILGAFWTDQNGAYIAPAAPTISMVAHHLEHEVRVIVDHAWHEWNGAGFPPAGGDAAGGPFGLIEGTNVAYAIHDTVLPMEALNDSLWLQSPMQWNSLEDFGLSSGDSVIYSIGDYPAGTILLVRCELEGEGLTAIDVFQYEVGEAMIPTLTEWGLIIFGVVLLGFITWVFLKRRKAIGVRI